MHGHAKCWGGGWRCAKAQWDVVMCTFDFTKFKWAVWRRGEGASWQRVLRSLTEHIPQSKCNPSNRSCGCFSQPIWLQDCEYLSSLNMIPGLNIYFFSHSMMSKLKGKPHSAEEMTGSMLQEKLSDFAGFMKIIHVHTVCILSYLWEMSRGMFDYIAVPPYKKALKSSSL